MRLCVISPFVDKRHGTERVLAELLERVKMRDRAEVHLYAQRISDLEVSVWEPAKSTKGILWHRVRSLRGPHLLQFVWWYFANRALRRREARTRQLSFDLTYSPGINAADVDAITVHIVFHAFYEQVRASLRLRGASLSAWPRTLHRILYYKLIMWFEKRIYSQRRIALSAVSQLVADQLARHFGREDVLVVRNAVDTKQFNSAARLLRRGAARATFSIGADEFVFLIIGNDWKKKGVDTLLRALALCTEISVRLFVVGQDSPEAYANLCDAIGVSARVRFLSPSADVLQFYAAADAYVGPSLEDAYGLPVLEAMACGLPVIASAAAGVSEIVTDGENGLILREPRDAEALAALLRRIATSPEFAHSLARAAERTAAGESWDAYTDRMIAHFEEVIAKKNSKQTRPEAVSV